MTHAKKLALTCLKNARSAWGAQAWDKLSPEIQRGAVSCEVVRILLMQDTDNPASALAHAQEVARECLLLTTT